MQTILVVEDELLIAEVVAAVLGDEGYKTVVAGNGQEALECLELARPDLILSDIMMPVMDGRELCKRLHAHPQHNAIPVVLMSSAYSSVNLDGCKHVAFLKKPFDIEDLVTTLSNILAQDPGSS
jgi:two-component system, OmpR family, alkaline phosphatase synthesis response regulator PhoP